jgi:hypothetical protein
MIRILSWAEQSAERPPDGGHTEQLDGGDQRAVPTQRKLGLTIPGLMRGEGAGADENAEPLNEVLRSAASKNETRENGAGAI